MTQAPYFDDERRSWLRAMVRGFGKKCPSCGKGKLFSGYMKNHEHCNICDLEISGHKADDAPPYFTIMVVGHIIIPLALAVRQIFEPSLALQFAIWMPVLLIATFLFLPRSKGAMIGLQWANRMHGFGTEPEALEATIDFETGYEANSPQNMQP